MCQNFLFYITVQSIIVGLGMKSYLNFPLYTFCIEHKGRLLHHIPYLRQLFPGHLNFWILYAHHYSYVSNTFYTFYYDYVILANYLYFGNFRYIQYSNACARAVRNSLKPELKVDAMKRGNSIIKATRWEEGKPVQGKYSSAQYIEYCRFHILREYFIPLSHHLHQNVTI